MSAAAIHGAAHQQPMVFQVVTDRPTRSARAIVELFGNTDVAQAVAFRGDLLLVNALTRAQRIYGRRHRHVR